MALIGAGVVAILALVEIACLGFLWKGPGSVSVLVEPGNALSTPVTRRTSHSFCATNVPLLTVLQQLNTTGFKIANEELCPRVNVNVRITWTGWHRGWYAAPEADPILKGMIENCEEKYGYSLRVATPTRDARPNDRTTMIFTPVITDPGGNIELVNR